MHPKIHNRGQLQSYMFHFMFCQTDNYSGLIDPAESKPQNRVNFQNLVGQIDSDIAAYTPACIDMFITK